MTIFIMKMKKAIPFSHLENEIFLTKTILLQHVRTTHTCLYQISTAMSKILGNLIRILGMEKCTELEMAIFGQLSSMTDV